MALTSLVVCADAKAVQVLSRSLQDLGIRVESCGDLRSALRLIEAQRFDALLVDCDNEQEALDLIAEVRNTSINQSTVVVAILDGQSQLRDAFARGANFVLYKPVSPERAAYSMRAARDLMRRERRLDQRITLHAPATISYAAAENISATLVDLSENGASIQSGGKLPPKCKVYFQFSLPGKEAIVRLSGEVMWQDAAGRAGIRFVDVPKTSRRILTGWVQEHALRPNSSESQVAQSSDAVFRENLSAGLGLLSSAADRRTLDRHACTLGADVYRLGDNTPNRCILSDVSTGGCYIETTEPFPAGTPVEIVVRTPGLKLAVHGRVQSVNAGFGMGVQFSVRTAAAKRQVEQLLACVPEPETFVEPAE